jgi:hypothetical protein
MSPVFAIYLYIQWKTLQGSLLYLRLRVPNGGN